MSSDKKTKTKDKLIGLQVYDAEGYNQGTVDDIAYTVGKVGLTLVIKTKGGESKEVVWENIQAAGDVVILKPKVAEPAPSEVSPASQQICPTCGEPLTYIPQYKRWYCYKDKKYV